MVIREVLKTKSAEKIKFFGRKNEVPSWGFTVTSRESSRRFLQVARRSLAPTGKAFKDRPNLLAEVAARLVCLDGVRPESLQFIALEISPPYQMGGSVAIEWHETVPPRTERRKLSPLTVAAWKAYADFNANPLKDAEEVPPPNAGNAPSSLQLSLISWLTQAGFYLGERYPLSKLSDDQMCWHAEILPGTLFAHCAGRLVLSALPRSCWARLESGLALRTIESDAQSNELEEPAMLRIADLVCEVQGKETNENLIQSALDILSQSHSSGVDGLTKRLWISELEKLNFKLTTNPQTVILIGWIIYICETGNLAASTIRSYARRTAMGLARSLAKFESLHADPETWPPVDLNIVYREIVNSQTVGNRTVCGASLASFQRYLEDIFETDFLQDYIHREKDDYIPTVAAEVLWDHEINWCIDSCTSAPDGRVGSIAKVMLAIARECPVRYQDLSRMTIRNVAFGQDSLGRYCELEVARDAYRGRLKTESSQRRLFVRGQMAIDAIETWCTERHEEGAPLNAYLFGDPADDKKRYRPTAVQALLNRLVKSASGSSSVKFHSLRHSVLSRSTAEVLASCTLVDVIPMEVLAASAGHASPMTTLRSYSHIYEEALRMWLDLGLRIQDTLTVNELAGTLDEAFPSDKQKLPNTLVQAAKRRNISPHDHWWHLLDRHALPHGLESVARPFSWGERITQIPHVHRTSMLTIPTVADMLIRLSILTPYSAVARIHGLSEDRVQLMCNQLEHWLTSVYREHFPRLSKREDSPLPLFQRMTKMHIDLKGMQSPTWTTLSSALETGVDSSMANEAIEHWVTQGRRFYVPLLPTSSARPLTRLLRFGEVNRDHIRVIVQHSNPLHGSTSEALSHHIDSPADGPIEDPMFDVARLFLEEMRIEPRFESAAWRCDRPMAYLQINPHAEKACTASKSDQSGSLKAWLVSIKAHQILTTLITTNE